MDWRHRAACLDEDPELFFPIGNTGPALLQIEEAKAVCRRCPVIDTCLQWALETGQDAGVWGGLSEDERRALKRRNARAAPRRLTHRVTASTAGAGLRTARRRARQSRRSARAAGAAGPSRDAVPPPSSRRRPLDAAAQLADQGAHDLRPEARPTAPSARRSGRAPEPSSRDLDAAAASSARPVDDRSPVDHAPRPGAAEPVLDRVLHQLGEDQRQRRWRPRRAAGRSAPPAGCAPRSAARHLDDDASGPRRDVVEVDRLVEALRQGLVHQRDGGRPGARPPRAPPRAAVVQAAGLQPQQRGHGLQVVLHPVVDLADRRVLGHQLALAPAQLGDVAQQHQRADALARPAVERDRAQRQRVPLRLEVGPPRRLAGEHERQPLVDGAARRGPAAVAISARIAPTSSPTWPSRWKADTAFGLA